MHWKKTFHWIHLSSNELNWNWIEEKWDSNWCIRYENLLVTMVLGNQKQFSLRRHTIKKDTFLFLLGIHFLSSLYGTQPFSLKKHSNSVLPELTQSEGASGTTNLLLVKHGCRCTATWSDHTMCMAFLLRATTVNYEWTSNKQLLTCTEMLWGHAESQEKLTLMTNHENKPSQNLILHSQTKW